MKKNIQIDAGIIELTVNGDASRIISFNPEDVLFVEKFYNLIKLFESKEEEYLARARKIEEAESEANTPDAIDLVKDLCTFLRAEIDNVFGVGTSQAAFEDAQTLNMFEQFFSGITPFIKQTREKKTAKYVSKKKV